MPRVLVIQENGRDGTITYREDAGSLSFYWEFGGGDVVAIVQCGDARSWEKEQWALAQRSEVLHFVASEVVRQKAPTCQAEINEDTGDILLRQGGAGTSRTTTAAAPAAPARAEAFVRRYSKLKAMLGLGGLVVVLIVGGMMWLGKKVLMTSPASGVPLGECVRTSDHIASLIQYTDPHLPEISGRGGNTTTSISILLIPLDGSGPKVVPVVHGLSGQGYDLSRIMGSDGRTLWFDCTGLFGVRLGDYALITPQDLRNANPSLDPSWWEDPRGMDIIDGKLHVMRIDRSAAMDVDAANWKATPVDPRPSNARFERHETTDQLAAGFITASGKWLGLHSAEELAGEFKVKSWIEAVEGAEDARQQRRLCTAELEPSSEGDHYRIRNIAPINDTEYLNAAFLRVDASSVPLLLKDPEGALMVYTDKKGLGGDLVVTRVDVHGKHLWNTDTGLDRFGVRQILPGREAFAFVGTRPPVPNKLSEPLVVIVDNATGKLTAYSLWR